MADTVTKIEGFLAQRFPASRPAQEYYLRLWRAFSDEGLGDDNFVRELTSGEAGRFEERAWEMILARRLASCGHQVASKAAGPDFCIASGCRKLWVEAIVPSPAGIPPEWLATPRLDGKADVTQVPFEPILLRWTAALKEKWEKLEGRTFINKATGVERTIPGYRAAGIVADEDVYVIAVNPCRLTTSRPIDEGASRLPFAMEAVLPVGPWAIPVDDNGRLGKAFRTLRYSIKNPNKSDVATDSFLNPAYAGVSALIGASTYSAAAEELQLIVIHNPYARNPLPQGLFGRATTEWVPSRVSEDEFEISPLQ
jgi:type I restriction enzyme S subunit